jgi:hypothetical protein
MARFVACDGGLVNLDHVARVREHRRSGGTMGHAVEAADGTVISRQSYPSGDAEELTAPVVPNTTGVTAIVVTPYAEDSVADRPSAVYTQNVPIVGWRLIYGGAIPVLIEPTAANQTVLVVLPEGQLLCPDDATFESLEEAKSALLACAQDNWDRAAKKRQPAEAAA